MIKVLVTGGTGFVGREIVGQLASLGYRVRLLSRSGKRAANLAARYGCEIVPGRLDDAGALDEACRGVDAVIHLVGIIAERGNQTFEQVHVEGTRHIVEAARRAGVRRYIHMSALGADTASPARYQRTKAQAEEIVRGSGMAWTIFRPSVVFGPRDQFVNRLAAMLRPPLCWLQLGAFPLIGGGGTLLQPIAVRDVAQAFVRALAHADTIGQTYDLVGPERLALREILAEIAQAVGRKRVFFFPLPWPLALFAGAVFERVLPNAPITVEQVIMLQTDSVGEIDPAAKMFGLAMAPFGAGIRAYLY